MQSQWKPLTTIPKSTSLQDSLPFMTNEEINLNIIQICIFTQLRYSIMADIKYDQKLILFKSKFGFKQNRYLLNHVINGSLSVTQKKKLQNLTLKFDQTYINGLFQQAINEQILLKMAKQKQLRSIFIQQKNKIIEMINNLSINLFQHKAQQGKLQTFQKSLMQLNEIIQKKQQQQEINNGSAKYLKGFVFCLNNQLRKIVNIDPKRSMYIETKNRNPLILDFQFGRFLYKNDDLLAHELIAMELINYINKILGKQYIVSYAIIPQKIGAFYQFVQNSLTIHQIKNINQQGIIGYFRNLTQKGNKQQIMNRFAQTYSGFCLIQYLLEIKDRNNCNIMIKQDGSIFHIDLTFILSKGPGGLSFQSAPFKMTKQIIKNMGGFQSIYFKKFQTLLVQHFQRIFLCKKQLLYKLQILGKRNKQIVCFADFKTKQFQKKLPYKKQKIKQFVQDLIDKSYDNWKTNKYDDYQFKSNNINK